ncbi:MAG: hypothetical protein A2381_00150 [Bdellovibrionales bacterium RIFOXYB1_FULL_37_110]|nr:MAG: hypothetical protein A2417_11205 [Bdellovibrionales bacterium RIFOXYC1_FULL_37_79]OFZ60883.1 MAG: hypothetical protein A2381_00150 [Bdellovibrionales bacterium RIFOXYB1_FULL_37_110]OFZ62498.1 MAG: hypothetical protein A2577_02815 [Bdellovibrionales bacterium RIFOXYD1_FULL_36_51]
MKDGRIFTIRNVTIDDAQTLLDYYNSFESDFEFRLSEKDELNLNLEKEIDFVKKLYDEKDSLGILAIYESQIIGFLDFHKKTLRRLSHIGSFGIGVHKSFINIGIGRALISTLIDWAKENPVIKKISLGVLSENIPAIALYKKMGFIEEGRFIKEIKLSDEKFIDNIFMYLWVK